MAGLSRLTLWLMLLAPAGGGAAEFRYASALPDEGRIVDTRSLEQCREMSLAGTRCLPATDLLGPHRRLPSFRDILWVFGTAGLRGDESVIVAGTNPRERDFVAALLYLAGQREVVVLTEPVPRLLASGVAAAPGEPRGMIRDPIYQAPMRERLLVLRSELWSALQGATPPTLFDGRSDEEYRGERVRAGRGGRLPGAISRPDRELRGSVTPAPRPAPAGLVGYAHDPLESLAYFTLLRAGAGHEARVYIQGWRDWAARGDLPVDHETLPEPASPRVKPSSAATAGSGLVQQALPMVALLIALLSLFIVVSRRSHRWTS